MIIPQYRAGCPHVTHPSATKMIKNPAEALFLILFVRLACVKHAASVHPEPGSNSYVKVSYLARFFWLSPVFSKLVNSCHSCKFAVVFAQHKRFAKSLPFHHSLPPSLYSVGQSLVNSSKSAHELTMGCKFHSLFYFQCSQRISQRRIYSSKDIANCQVYFSIFFTFFDFFCISLK